MRTTQQITMAASRAEINKKFLSCLKSLKIRLISLTVPSSPVWTVSLLMLELGLGDGVGDRAGVDVGVRDAPGMAAGDALGTNLSVCIEVLLVSVA